MKGYGCAGGSVALLGFVQMEIARIDPSFSTFMGVHIGLAMGSIYIDGSEEQKQKWLPPMARFEKIGCFGLTEPLVGSGASGGLLTTAKREGDTWILNGEKRWIGNAPWCDVSIIWARDLADNQVKGFIVENKTTPGFSVEKIENKIALKVVQNGHITLKDCRVSEANRLQGGNSFRDTAKVLKMTRYAVAWMATGCAMGAYEAALKYTQERLQFGRPIGSFQLVQDLLAKMIANITASQCLIVRQAQLHAEGKLTDAHAALAKAFCTAKCRETVAWARELLGGNGIVADYKVARFFIIEEGLSYEIYTRTVEPNARPIIIQPDGDLTINYLDTHGLPLTAEQLASAMALVAKIAGVSSDEDKQLSREAQIAKYIMLLYEDVFEEWSRRNAERLLEIARHACTLAKLKRTRPGATTLDVFVDFRDRQRTDADLANQQLAEVTEEEALRFLKEPNTRREVRNLAFAYFTPAEYPTHRMLQELIQLDASDSAAGDLATRLLPWCADGNYGCLLDGASNISLTGKIAHFELGYIPEAAKLLRAVAGFLITNYTRQHIITMPRRLRKRNVYEEVARLLDIPGGEQIVNS